ncbi:MAG: helix-turn-helix transcriptional regulator [Clostridia bacterium]|nr:helix-turn-helix transcriptional regulator [Clostridia bacterium]
MAKVYVTAELAETIKSIRLQNKVLAKSLAKEINKSPSYITKLEKGEIQTIDVDELNTILSFIAGNNASLDDIMERIYAILKYKYSDDEIEKQVWFANYDTVKRRIPIPDALIDEINDRIDQLNLSRQYLLSRINANESLTVSDKENESIQYNIWYSPENKPKGAQSIKIRMEESRLNDILDKKIDVTRYIYLLSIVFYLIKIEKFNDIVYISDDDTADIMTLATEFLSKHRFYSILSKNKALETASSQEEQLQLLSSFDRKNIEIVNEILKKIKYMSEADVKNTNNYLESFDKNLEWDLGFTMKLISLNFYTLGQSNYSDKKNLLVKIEDLIKQYNDKPSAIKSIEKY